MKLTELDATFVKLTDPRGDFQEGISFDEAHGVMFDCPKCRSHSVVCWSRSRGVPDDVHPGPGRWMMVGTGLDDLTLNADPPGTARSVQLNGGCAWHGHVTNGDAA